MNLGNIFQARNQSVNQADTSRASAVPSASERNYRIMNEARGLIPGQTIQGEVVGKEGNTVQIALDSENVLTARLERDLNIALGQNMSFEVRINNGEFLSLTPLYANMTNEATILKALSAAGLSANPANMQMVSDMMQEGMSIDKDTIAYVNRQLADFPDVAPSSIMQMIRLGIPISGENIEQFELYKNYEHQIVQSAEQIMEELPQTYFELLSEGKDAEAVTFYEQIIKAFVGAESAADMEGTVSMIQDAADAADEAGMAGETLQKAVSGEMISDLQEEMPNTGGAEKETINTNGQNSVVQETAAQETAGQGQAAEGMPDRASLSPETWQALGNMLRNLGADEESSKQIENGDLTPKETLSKLNELLFGQSGLVREGIHESVKELFGSKEFQNLLQTEITNQWLLKPEEVAQKKEVEQLYERIREQTAKINEAFQMVDKADASGAKSTQNLQNNVDFMNQMNQMFTYVQLPLMMAGNQAHGDLYVYTNKKSLAKKDGNVSALLHLDMENLGPMDVYVTMQQNQKVSTNFTLRDEEALDLIAEHIHILDDRLARRGYSMSANFKLKEEDTPDETNVMHEILAQNKNISVLSRTSFDMRA